MAKESVPDFDAVLREAGVSSEAESAEAKALEVHAAMLKAGFEPCTDGFAPLAGGAALPREKESWRKQGDTWVFFYRNERSSLRYTLKVTTVGTKLVALLDNGTDTDPVQQTTLALKTQGQPAVDVASVVKTDLIDKAMPCEPSWTQHVHAADPPSCGDSRKGPPPPAAAPSSSSSTTNPTFDYGRSDLTPGGVGPGGRLGGSLLGPEGLRDIGGRGGSSGPRHPYGQFTPDGYFAPEIGNDIVPPPPGARYDPVHPDDPTQFLPQGKGGKGGFPFVPSFGPRGFGPRGPGGFGGGFGGGDMYC